MDLYGFIWIYMDLCGFIWIYMDLYGFMVGLTDFTMKNREVTD